MDQDDRRPVGCSVGRSTTEYDVAVNRCPDTRQFRKQGSSLTVSFGGRRRDGRVVDGGGLENR